MEEPLRQAQEFAAISYPKVFRTDFTQSGFALFNLGRAFGSQLQRKLMVELKNELERRDQQQRGQNLTYQSLGRFDQQVTTKPHRDGGPDQSILMLGYEPTTVQCRISIADYAKCAFDMELTPAEFLEQYNPMFPDGFNRLSDYSVELTDFDHTAFQILIINNSITPIGDDRLVGVLHTATIVNPDPDQSRVVNSTMIACNAESPLGTDDEQHFIDTQIIRREKYEL